MQAFDLTCLSTAEIKNRQSSIIKKAIAVITILFLSAGINYYFSNRALVFFSMFGAFLSILVAYFKYELYQSVKSALAEQSLLSMVQEHPELASYREQVVAHNRPFISYEFYSMRQWCKDKKQEKVTQVLYPK